MKIRMTIGLILLGMIFTGTEATAAEMPAKAANLPSPPAKEGSKPVGNKLVTEGVSESTDEAALKPEVQMETKEVEGPVAYVDSLNISVTYAQKGDAEYDMFLPFNKKQELSRYKNISEIKRGDTVKIIYDEITTAKDKPDMRVERKIKKIKFVKRPSE